MGTTCEKVQRSKTARIIRGLSVDFPFSHANLKNHAAFRALFLMADEKFEQTRQFLNQSEKLKEKTRMRIPTLLAAASVAIFAVATTANAQTSSGSGGVPTNGTSSSMGETNPGPTSDKGTTPPATQRMPNKSTSPDSSPGPSDSVQQPGSLDH